jgi:dTDP-glucose 4,6-dehydratase/UDP-glucose 4-epimerase
MTRSRAAVRYLITGGAGFIGSNLAVRLLADGHSVSVLDDFSRGRRGRLPAWTDLDVHEGDVRDPVRVAAAMQGCDAVIHAAYIQGTQTFYAEPRQVLDVALRGMLAVLDACAVTGCADLLLISSSEAYQVAGQVPTPETVPLTVPDPLNPRYSYGGGKIACELMALAWERAGVLDRVIIARPHNIYGPDMGKEHVIPEFCLRMNRLTASYPEGPIPFPVQGSGLETRSFCFIGDCTAQLALLLDPRTPAGIYHAGTMDEITISQVAHLTAEYYGRRIKLEPGKLPQGSPPRRLPDVAKIAALARGAGVDLPRTPFTRGLPLTVAWYRENT